MRFGSYRWGGCISLQLCSGRPGEGNSSAYLAPISRPKPAQHACCIVPLSRPIGLSNSSGWSLGCWRITQFRNATKLRRCRFGSGQSSPRWEVSARISRNEQLRLWPLRGWCLTRLLKSRMPTKKRSNRSKFILSSHQESLWRCALTLSSRRSFAVACRLVIPPPAGDGLIGTDLRSLEGIYSSPLPSSSSLLQTARHGRAAVSPV